MGGVMKKFFILGIILIIFCGGKGEKPIKNKGPEIQAIGSIKKSILIVIAHKDFRDEEFKEPYELMRKAGFKVVIASTDTTPAKGMLGMVVKPDMLISEVNPDSFDAVIISGGVGCKTLWDNTELHKIVQNHNQNHKIIGAICIAPVVLARAGVLQGKKATVYPGVADEIKLCAEYTGSDVEQSENIITASGPDAAKKFAQTILEAIKK
jgi:protease I